MFSMIFYLITKLVLSHQIPQAVTFLLDALKSYQAEGWRLLELQTLRDIAKCYREVYSLSRERYYNSLRENYPRSNAKFKVDLAAKVT